MMGRWLGTVLWLWLISPAMAAGLDAASVNNAEYRSKASADDKIEAAIVKAQVLLDRAQFSPGEIDGMSCTRFRRHRVRCFMEQEVRHGEKAVYAGVQA